MNYLAIHKPSQLILKVITSPSQPTPDEHHSFHEASATTLNKFYKLVIKARRNGVQVTVGDLMDSCPSFKEQVSNGKQGKARLASIRYRKESTPTVVDRHKTICDWIKANADADAHDLSNKFLTGTVVAKAYLNKYRHDLL